MTFCLQQFIALIKIAARLHWCAAKHQHASIDVQFFAKLFVPDEETVDCTVGRPRILQVRTVLHAHDLTDIGRGSEGMWNRSLVDHSDGKAAAAQLKRGGYAIDATPHHQDIADLCHWSPGFSMAIAWTAVIWTCTTGLNVMLP